MKNLSLLVLAIFLFASCASDSATDEQEELFEKLAETLGTEPAPQEKGFLDWLSEALGG